jgi:uncharacterized membrane protein
MGFWTTMGLLVGALLGAMAGGIFTAAIVGAIGAGIGALVGRGAAASPSAPRTEPPPAVHYGERTPDSPRVDPAPVTTPPKRPVETPPALPPELLQRLDALDAKLGRIEARLLGAPVERGLDTTRVAAAPGTSIADIGVPVEAQALASVSTPAREPPVIERVASPVPASEPLAIEPVASALPLPEAPVVEPVASPARASAPLIAPVARASVAASPSAEREPLVRAADGTMQPPAAAPPGTAPPPREPPPPAAPSALWRFITGGNAVTRVGIVILFFGVAFLLTYFAEVVTIPIEVKLAGAALGGLALAGLGVLLARKRPSYGLSLEGAGMGVVYLVVFAAFRLYDVLAPAPAIALLVVVSLGTVGLALRHDAQPLAALALAGGFLAPVLIRSDTPDPLLLFTYFAILNAAIFAIAWRRAWRGLNVLGFVFTFALGLFWGARYYTPAHYATVQPFLALFFLYYVAIAILYARRGALDARAPIDGLLVFGVPVVGFALQMAIVRGYRYGVAWSAAGLSVFYAGLWWWLRSRRDVAGTALLSTTFLVLAVGFATLAIPFAVDPRVTSAWWAVEAAAVYWIGCVQRQPRVRMFALLLQIAAAVAFVIDRPVDGGAPFLNAGFLGAALIGLAALASAWLADRHREALSPNERALVPWLFVWGAAWWTLGGLLEVRRQVLPPAAINAALAWIVATVALALIAGRALRWSRAGWIGAMLLPAMLLAGLADLAALRTTLRDYGWLVWPFAWMLQWGLLRADDAMRDARNDQATPTRDDFVQLSHTASAIMLVAWASWEASEWTGRNTSAGTVWIACAAALPSLVYLSAVAFAREPARWPLGRYAEAYGRNAGTAVATLLVVWFALVNLASPGDATPLPYVPIVNPLEIVLAATLFVLARWAQRWTRFDAPTLVRCLGAGAFLALTAGVVRAAHQWGDVPWRLDALLAYRPLQAALTLAWTVTALALMLWATRKSIRIAWMTGAVLLAVVVVKLFAIDLAALSGLTRVIAFLGVGALLLVIGYVAPLPPAAAEPAIGAET